MLFKTKEKSDYKLALQIYNHLSGRDVSPFYIGKVLKLEKTFENKKALLMEAVRLCGEPENKDKLYVVSQCYVLAGAEYRPHAIDYLNKFIDCGATWSGTPRQKIDMGDYVADQLTQSKAEIWWLLAHAYEGEYQFEDSLKAYLTSFSIDNTYTPAVNGAADVYVKMNNIDGGLKFLREVKKLKYKDMKLFAASKIDELREKKKNGYVYKPRPRKKKKANAEL